MIHAEAFEPMEPGDPFGDMMNAPKKYVVSRTLDKPIWRDTTIIRDNVIESVRALKAQPGRNIVTDGSSELVHALLAHDLVDELHLLLYPLTLGSGKRVLPNGVHTMFALTSSRCRDDCNNRTPDADRSHVPRMDLFHAASSQPDRVQSSEPGLAYRRQSTA